MATTNARRRRGDARARPPAPVLRRLRPAHCGHRRLGHVPGALFVAAARLESEPDLTRYYVILPIDLPAGDTETRSSAQTPAQTRWDGKVVEWRALAAQRGMQVEFVLLGAHELVSALTLPKNEGRARYWFGADVLTDQWQSRRLEEALTKAGRRYTPQVHVEVHTVQALHAVGRSTPYVDRWRVALAGLREARRWGWRSPSDDKVFDSALARCAEALNTADTSLQFMITALGSSADLPPWTRICPTPSRRLRKSTTFFASTV